MLTFAYFLRLFGVRALSDFRMNTSPLNEDTFNREHPLPTAPSMRRSVPFCRICVTLIGKSLSILPLNDFADSRNPQLVDGKITVTDPFKLSKLYRPPSIIDPEYRTSPLVECPSTSELSISVIRTFPLVELASMRPFAPVTITSSLVERTSIRLLPPVTSTLPLTEVAVTEPVIRSTLISPLIDSSLVLPVISSALISP